MSRVVQVAPSALRPGSFRYHRTIRFGDCDPAGIVYYPRFVEMVHDAIEAWIGAPGGLGLDYHAMIRSGTGFPTARLEMDFLAPATMGEQLAITPVVARIGGASLELVLHAHRGEVEVFRGRLILVTVSIGAMQPIPLPAPFREALEAQHELAPMSDGT